jgi:hypothetical protein
MRSFSLCEKRRYISEVAERVTAVQPLKGVFRMPNPEVEVSPFQDCNRSAQSQIRGVHYRRDERRI